MPKRKSTKFGGGTGDVNPQWFNMNPQTTVGAYADVATTLPRERLPYGNKSQVMEVLKVEFFPDPILTLAMTAATFSSIRLYLLTKTFGGTEPLVTQMSGNVLARKVIMVANTAAAPAVDIYLAGIDGIVDLTDGAGNGVLAATDQLFLGVANSAFTAGGTVKWGCRLLYRWKNVSLAEYIGIVQSQQ